MTEPTTSSTSTSSTAGSTRPSTGNHSPTTENEVTSTSFSTSTQSTSATPSSPVVIAGAVVGGVAAFLLLVILIRICCKRRSGNSDPKSEQFNADINQTNTDLTLDRLEQSQISFNEYGDLDSIQHGLQDDIIYVPSPSPISGPAASYAGTLPVQTAETIDPSLIYAKPIRTKTQKTERELKKQQSDPNDNPTTEQSYNNPAFDYSVSDGTTAPYWDDSPTPTPAASVRPTRPIKPTPYKPNPSQRNTLGRPNNDNPVIESSVSDGTTTPSGVDLSTSIKPIALVRPTRPSKPRPYKPKQAERMSDAPSTHYDRMPPSPPPLTSVNDGAPSLENTDDSPYAQDSVPMRQQSSHGNPASEDHIVYADLDLQSDEIQDGGHHPQPASEAVLYSSVMMN